MKFKWQGTGGYLKEMKDVPAFSVKAPASVDVEARTIEAVISSNTVDRDGEIIHPKAFEKRIDTYMKNPVVLWSHDPSSNAPIGRVDALEINDDTIEAKMTFRPKGASALADDVFDAYATGFLKTFSIGFRVFEVHQPKDSEGKSAGPLEVVDAELFELSAVPIPANPDAAVKTLRILKTIGAAEYKTGTDTLFVQPSDLDVLGRAKSIIEQALDTREKGDFVCDDLLRSIESLRLSVLCAMAKSPVEEGESGDEVVADLLGILKGRH